LNQAATDAKPRKRYDFRHSTEGLYAAKQQPGFKSKNAVKPCSVTHPSFVGKKIDSLLNF
jgi:hypothetical protein